MTATPSTDHSDWRTLAERMVKSQLAMRGLEDERVLDAMRRVPRHAFVGDRLPLEDAYADRALPTAHGQTISQPYIVARMTSLLDVRPGHRVFEIGTGSGYQTAVLLHLGAAVWSIETDADLAAAARDRLTEHYPGGDWHVRSADGSVGWPEAGPYDRILVTAGAPAVPDTLTAQLCDPGRMVIPTGPRDSQTLAVLDKHDGQLTTTDDLPCRFVPLTGEQGW